MAVVQFVSTEVDKCRYGVFNFDDIHIKTSSVFVTGVSYNEDNIKEDLAIRIPSTMWRTLMYFAMWSYMSDIASEKAQYMQTRYYNRYKNQVDKYGRGKYLGNFDRVERNRDYV